MNIFFVDKDPKAAAIALCDKHVVKMVLETAQILSTVVREKTDYAESLEGVFYKPTHKNHPCTLWAGHNQSNFSWLYEHGVALNDEYTKRYSRIHKSGNTIKLASEIVTYLPEGNLTPPALAMPKEYQSDIPVEAYRNYYRYKTTIIDARWDKGRERPDWL